MQPRPRIRPLPDDYTAPSGSPDIAVVRRRTDEAADRLNLRGQAPELNPFVTAWQLHALIRTLVHRGFFTQEDMDNIGYFTELSQLEDLEALLEQKPRAQKPLTAV